MIFETATLRQMGFQLAVALDGDCKRGAKRAMR
jgi:hypothetical protein